jgi:hypothetical protein
MVAAPASVAPPRASGPVAGVGGWVGRVSVTVVMLAAAVAAGWGLWAGIAWLSYGKVGPAPDDDRLVTVVMPRYEVAERQQRLVAAPWQTTFAVTQRFDLQQSPVVSAVFSARERLLRTPGEPAGSLHPMSRQPLVQQVLALGWRVVAANPGRELVFGAVTQPWRPTVQFRGLSPERFTAFDSAGYAKIVWSIAVDSLGPRLSRVRTETRAVTTDAAARSRFRRYWAIFSPGILLIRFEALRTIASQAQSLTRSER